MVNASNSFDSIVKSMHLPSFYNHDTTNFQIVETHVSIVFLAGEHVYKMKKPVDFGFLDFMELSSRKIACEQEVVLNERSALGIYYGVLSLISNKKGGYIFSSVEDPQALEYVVHMKRLPGYSMLDQRVINNEISNTMFVKLGRFIGEYHFDSYTNPEITKTGEYEGVAFNIEENFSQVTPYIGTTIDKSQFDLITSYARGFLHEREKLFRTRAREGFVRDVHGDLRLAQISILNDEDIFILDCIEFNNRMRWIDTAADISFILMDLNAENRPDLVEILYDSYLDKAHDTNVGELIDFYSCYRAFVRGKIESFALDNPELSVIEKADIADNARKYFKLANSYAKNPIRQDIVLVAGLMGSGKTTLSLDLAKYTGYVYISSDVIRNTVLRAPSLDKHRKKDALNEGMYTDEMNRKTYDLLYSQASEALEKGHSIIIDATFSKKSERNRFKELAVKLKVEQRFIFCKTSDDVATQRLKEREEKGDSISDGRRAIYFDSKKAYDVIDFSKENFFELDANKLREEMLDEVLILLGKLD